MSYLFFLNKKTTYKSIVFYSHFFEVNNKMKNSFLLFIFIVIKSIISFFFHLQKNRIQR